MWKCVHKSFFYRIYLLLQVSNEQWRAQKSWPLISGNPAQPPICIATGCCHSHWPRRHPNIHDNLRLIYHSLFLLPKIQDVQLATSSSGATNQESLTAFESWLVNPSLHRLWLVGGIPTVGLMSVSLNCRVAGNSSWFWLMWSQQQKALGTPSEDSVPRTSRDFHTVCCVSGHLCNDQNFKQDSANKLQFVVTPEKQP